MLPYSYVRGHSYKGIIKHIFFFGGRSAGVRCNMCMGFWCHPQKPYHWFQTFFGFAPLEAISYLFAQLHGIAIISCQDDPSVFLRKLYFKMFSKGIDRFDSQKQSHLAKKSLAVRKCLLPQLRIAEVGGGRENLNKWILSAIFEQAAAVNNFPVLSQKVLALEAMTTVWGVKVSTLTAVCPPWLTFIIVHDNTFNTW